MCNLFIDYSKSWLSFESLFSDKSNKDDDNNIKIKFDLTSISTKLQCEPIVKVWYDFTIKITNPKKHIELFIVKIKPNKPNNTLVSKDLVTFGKMMKCAIDKSIKDDADDLVIYGMQIIGKYIFVNK